MRKLLVLAVLFSPSAVFAATDIRVESLSIHRETIRYREPLRVAATVVNHGPEAASVTFEIRTGFSMVLALSAPPSWRCDTRLFEPAERVSCRTEEMRAGERATFHATLLHLPRTDFVGVVASAQPEGGDTRPLNNLRDARAMVEPPQTNSDLAIAFTPERQVVSPDAKVTLRASITNHGGDELTNVHAIFSRADVRAMPMDASGSGWRCTTYEPRVVCTRSFLAGGETAFIDLAFNAPPEEEVLRMQASALAERNGDPVTRNNNAFALAGVSREAWTKLLLPLTTRVTTGANGTRWITDVTMLLRSTTPVELAPGPCDFDCFPFVPERPLNTPFQFDAVTPGALGQFVYVRASDIDKLSVNIRAYAEGTNGAEIPVVRERDFTTGTLMLLDVPVAHAQRYALRIYEADGRASARVRIHLFVNDERTPRVSVERTLERPPGASFITTALLPTHPASLQLDPLQLLDSIDGIERLRIDIEPVDEGLRLWAFVSIAKDTTNHVTTVVP